MQVEVGGWGHEDGSGLEAGEGWGRLRQKEQTV